VAARRNGRDDGRSPASPGGVTSTGLLHSSVTTTLELQTTDRGGGNPTLDYGLRAAV
jgi:hypothetical protein